MPKTALIYFKMKENINQLKKEIEEYHKKKKEEGMSYKNMDKKITNRVLKAKLQTLQEVCKDINKIMNPLKLSDEEILHEDRNWWSRYKQLLKKFQGDEK